MQKKIDMFVHGHIVCIMGFYQILAQMLEASRKFAWNLINDCKMPQY